MLLLQRRVRDARAALPDELRAFARRWHLGAIVNELDELGKPGGLLTDEARGLADAVHDFLDALGYADRRGRPPSRSRVRELSEVWASPDHPDDAA